MRRLERILVGIALMTLASTAARADRIVYFKSGKAIVVSAVEEKEGWIFLNFVGGGVLGVPAATIDRVEQTDLAQELGSSFGNTIQTPDSSRSAGRPRSTGRLPTQTGASRQSGNPQQPAGMQRTSPQLPRLGATSTNQLRPGGPAVGKRNQTPPNPFGLIPLNLNPNSNTGRGDDRRGEEKEEEDNEE